MSDAITTRACTRMKRADVLAAIGEQHGKRSRYPVAPKAARTCDGIVFDSKGEMLRYQRLKLLERVGEISHLELQPAFPIVIRGVKVCVVHPDFKYTTKAGDVVVEDVKGRGAGGTRGEEAYRLRKRLVEAEYSIKIVEV